MILYLKDEHSACIYRLCLVCNKEEAADIVHHDMSFILIDENDNYYDEPKLIAEWEV